jgi:large subunit ribosomal protein L22
MTDDVTFRYSSPKTWWVTGWENFLPHAPIAATPADPNAPVGPGKDMPPVRAFAKGLGASQKRLKPILDSVRGSRVEDAINTLSLMTSPWAKTVSKVVQSAAANAENNMLMNRNALKIVQITADRARPLKRFRPRARGRMGRITKGASHLTVVVDEEEA